MNNISISDLIRIGELTGRDLEIEVAKALGWRVSGSDEPYEGMPGWCLYDPLGNGAGVGDTEYDAWALRPAHVENPWVNENLCDHIVDTFGSIEIIKASTKAGGRSNMWNCWVSDHVYELKRTYYVRGQGETKAIAVCRAFLLAKAQVKATKPTGERQDGGNDE